MVFTRQIGRGSWIEKHERLVRVSSFFPSIKPNFEENNRCFFRGAFLRGTCQISLSAISSIAVGIPSRSISVQPSSAREAHGAGAGTGKADPRDIGPSRQPQEGGAAAGPVPTPISMHPTRSAISSASPLLAKPAASQAFSDPGSLSRRRLG